MAQKRYVRTLTLYLTEDLDRRLAVAYQTNRRAWKRNSKGAWIRKSQSDFVADLVTTALDNDATFEGSRVVLAGAVGQRISTKLDNILLVLYAFLSLFCRAVGISDAQKNEAFKRAAVDVQFDQRLTDLRQFYQTKASETESP